MRIRPNLTTDLPANTALYAQHGLHRTATFELEAPDEAAIHPAPPAMRQGIGRLRLAEPIALHRTPGFEHTGVLKASGWKFDRWLDVIPMQRPPGPGAGSDPADADKPVPG